MEAFVQHLTVFVLACFVGWYVVWKVTPALHTPLMSATNAISGIILVGAMVTAGQSAVWADPAGSPMSAKIGLVFAFLGMLLASINVVGGFGVTQRMLSMFKKRDA